MSVDGRWLGQGPTESDDDDSTSVVEFDGFDPQEYGSARLLVVWLTDRETYTVSALRPAHTKGQDRDELTVGLPESQAKFQVFDPRLSTEYDANGTPTRFGIELWLGEDEDGEQHPLRLSGEAPAGTVALTDGQLSIHPMRARHGEIDGFGLYLLVR